jgi:hypothetical protein
MPASWRLSLCQSTSAGVTSHLRLLLAFTLRCDYKLRGGGHVAPGVLGMEFATPQFAQSDPVAERWVTLPSTTRVAL